LADHSFISPPCSTVFLVLFLLPSRCTFPIPSPPVTPLCGPSVLLLPRHGKVTFSFFFFLDSHASTIFLKSTNHTDLPSRLPSSLIHPRFPLATLFSVLPPFLSLWAQYEERVKPTLPSWPVFRFADCVFVTPVGPPNGSCAGNVKDPYPTSPLIPSPLFFWYVRTQPAPLHSNPASRATHQFSPLSPSSASVFALLLCLPPPGP